MPWPLASRHHWGFTTSGSRSTAFGFGVSSHWSTGLSVQSSPDLVCSPKSQKHARNYFTWSCLYLGMKTEGPHVNSKIASLGEKGREKTQLGWEAEIITSNNPSVTSGNRYQNKSFPSVVSLSLWLIVRKILETSWSVLWPQHLGCGEGWQIYFRSAPQLLRSLGMTQQSFANEHGVIFHESLWSI